MYVAPCEPGCPHRVTTNKYWATNPLAIPTYDLVNFKYNLSLDDGVANYKFSRNKKAGSAHGGAKDEGGCQGL